MVPKPRRPSSLQWNRNDGSTTGPKGFISFFKPYQHLKIRVVVYNFFREVATKNLDVELSEMLTSCDSALSTPTADTSQMSDSQWLAHTWIAISKVKHMQSKLKIQLNQLGAGDKNGMELPSPVIAQASSLKRPATSPVVSQVYEKKPRLVTEKSKSPNGLFPYKFNEKGEYICWECPEVFPTSERPLAHLLDKTKKLAKGKPFACLLCGLKPAAYKPVYIQKHLASHTERELECPKKGENDCRDQKFANQERLDIHLAKIHDPTTRQLQLAQRVEYACPECPKVCQRKDKLQDHIKCMHGNVKLVECECGSFVRAHGLNAHPKANCSVASGVGEWLCRLKACPNSRRGHGFKSQATAQSHDRTHDQYRDFENPEPETDGMESPSVQTLLAQADEDFGGAWMDGDASDGTDGDSWVEGDEDEDEDDEGHDYDGMI